MGRIHVDLTGPPQTMLATLYAKALDAAAQPSILDDRWAAAVVSQIDYDWARTGVNARSAPGVALRSAHFDRWTREFIAAHPRAAVLHLGCGLDSRVFRVDPGAGVEWFDIDHPAVIALREQVYPAREHYTTIPASVTSPDWVAALPNDRPVLVLAEGLTMYLTETDGQALLRRLVEHFPSGEIQFDAFSRFGIRLQKINVVVRRSGSTLQWPIETAADIVGAVPGVRPLVVESVFDAHDYAELGPAYRGLIRLMSKAPVLRSISTYHRYAF